jgi:type IV secretion system protein VirB10
MSEKQDVNQPSGSPLSAEPALATPLAKKEKRHQKIFFFIMGVAGILVGVTGLRSCFAPQATPTTTTQNTPGILSGTNPPPLLPPGDKTAIVETPATNAMIPADSDRFKEAREQAEKLAQMRQIASAQAYSSDGDNNATSQNSSNAVSGGNGAGDANTQFMSQLASSKTQTEQATRIAHPGATLLQGGIIQATLETRIASDLPGMVRAITSDDVYADDGSQVLLPRGSRLVGQYTNSIQQGQQRVFVVWQRVIRPDHIDIQLNSPGTDTLGTAGLSADHIDHHFIEQLGMASLLSVIGAGTASAGVSRADQFNSASAYREALASSFNNTAKKTLDNQGVIQPTLYINQGSKISVFVARDLDFHDQLGVGAAQ